MAQWIITRDIWNEQDPDSDTNDVGERSRSTRESTKAEDLPVEFRLLDSDDEVYYYGRTDEEGSFEPLDDFGQGNAGCTAIQYRNAAGVWETL